MVLKARDETAQILRRVKLHARKAEKTQSKQRTARGGGEGFFSSHVFNNEVGMCAQKTKVKKKKKKTPAQ